MKKSLLKTICMALVAVLCIGSLNAQSFTERTKGTPSNTSAFSTATLTQQVMPEKPSAPAAKGSIVEDVESHTAFTINSPGAIGWSYYNGNPTDTWGINGITFPNAYQPMAYIVFNPSQTSPSSATTYPPHSGNQFFACFNPQNGAADAWIISPPFTAEAGATISFWAKEIVTEYGPELFKVSTSSTGNAPANFTNVISPGAYVSVTTTTWTQYTYNIPLNAKYVAITCMSDDVFALLIDDITINGIAEDAVCDPVTNLNATDNGSDVTLTWAATGTPTGFDVFRNGTLLATVTSTSYIDANVANGAYTYCVEANYADGCVPKSVCTSISVMVMGDCTLDEIIVGTATDVAYNLPINTFYNYSYTQQIFTAAELGLSCEGGDIIHEVSFEYIYSIAQGPGGKNNQIFYLGNTTKDGFTGTEWVPVAEMQQVYSGTVQYNNSQPWSTITFDEPFIHTGGNIVLAVVNNHGGYNTGSISTFRVHTPTGARKTQLYQTDGSPINPLSPPAVTSTSVTARSNTKFGVCMFVSAKDMAAVSLTGEMSPMATEANDYNLLVKNAGTTPVSKYTVSIVTADGTVLATETITTPLSPNATKVHTFSIAFPQALAGELTIKGVVEMAGDERACNNETPLTVNVKPHPGFVLDCNTTIVGTGTTANFYTPTGNYHGYAYLQQIYDASELAGLTAGDVIESISFQYTATTAMLRTNQSIYLGNTTKSTFANTSDWIPLDQLELVYEVGSINFNNSEPWFTITFDHPFTYTGNGIVLAWLNNQNGWSTTGTFRNTTITGKVLYRGADSGGPFSPAAPGTGTIRTDRANVKFDVCSKLYTLHPNNILDPRITMDPDPVPEGGNATVTIDLNDDCQILIDVIIGGVSMGPIDSYEFTDVTDVLPEIELITEYYYYDITATAGPNGSIDPEGIVPVQCGTNQLFDFIPDYGYVVDYFEVDDVVKPKNYKYNFIDVKETHTIHVEFKEAPYQITFTHVGDGEVIPVGREAEIENGIIFMDEGDMQQFLFVPGPHSIIQSVIIDGLPNPGAVISGSYFFTNIHSSHTIHVIFKLIDVTIIATAGANGSITPAGNVPVPYGTDQIFTICPNTGYVLDQLLVNGEPAVGVPASGNCYTYMFEDVTEPQTIHATFTKATVNILVTTCVGGSADYEGNIPVIYNEILKVTFYPDEGYKVSEVLVDGAPYPQAIQTGSYTFYYVTENHTLHVCFAKITYPVSAHFNENGYFTEGMEGTTQVPHGTDATYTYVPMPGYKIANVFIDGYDTPDAAAAGTYTFENVTEPHSIDVVTAQLTYTIEASAGEGGFISPAGTLTVTYGQSQMFAITTAPGHEIEQVLVDNIVNGEAALNGFYTFMNVNEDHTIEVVFKKLRYQMQAIANPNGSISNEGITEVEYGDDMTYTITPEEGYQISFVLVNGSNMGTIDTYTFVEIEENGIIEAFFKVIHDPTGLIEPTLDGVTIYSQANTVYVINNSNLSINDVSIFDMFGRIIWQGKVYNERNMITLNVATGIYTVRVTTDREVTSTKVSIQR